MSPLQVIDPDFGSDVKALLPIAVESPSTASFLYFQSLKSRFTSSVPYKSIPRLVITWKSAFSGVPALVATGLVV